MANRERAGKWNTNCPSLFEAQFFSYYHLFPCQCYSENVMYMMMPLSHNLPNEKSKG